MNKYCKRRKILRQMLKNLVFRVGNVCTQQIFSVQLTTLCILTKVVVIKIRFISHEGNIKIGRKGIGTRITRQGTDVRSSQAGSTILVLEEILTVED